jgi:hypothetical protein
MMNHPTIFLTRFKTIRGGHRRIINKSQTEEDGQDIPVRESLRVTDTKYSFPSTSLSKFDRQNKQFKEAERTM